MKSFRFSLKFAAGTVRLSFVIQVHVNYSLLPRPYHLSNLSVNKFGSLTVSISLLLKSFKMRLLLDQADHLVVQADRLYFQIYVSLLLNVANGSIFEVI